MKDSKPRNENNKIRLSAILEKMPLYRFMDESRAILLKLHPAWKIWLAKNVPSASDENTVLLSFDSGLLTVATENSTTATLLKNFSTKATTDLQPKVNQLTGLELKQIKFLVQPDIWLTDKQDAEHAQHVKSPTQLSNRPNDDAIKSIELLQKSVRNSELSSSLEALAKTLNNLKRKHD